MKMVSDYFCIFKAVATTIQINETTSNFAESRKVVMLSLLVQYNQEYKIINILPRGSL